MVQMHHNGIPHRLSFINNTVVDHNLLPLMSFNMDYTSENVNLQEENEFSMPIRTVSMSANIAKTVREEVKHLIRVSTIETDTNTDSWKNMKTNTVSGDKPAHNMQGRPTLTLSATYVLPTVEENIISAIILSKWDDIMGPQTVHVWFHEKDESFTSEVQDLDNVPHKVMNADLSKRTLLGRAVKYVTSHTVNYTGVCTHSASVERLSHEHINEPRQTSSSFFVVPELDLVAQALVFHLSDQKLKIPYSLAVMVSYHHYNYFLHLRELCKHWLQRMAARLHVILLKAAVLGEVPFKSNDNINGWMIDFCNMVLTLRIYGIGMLSPVQQEHILNQSLLDRILTSHLQTFGCTVVMGSSSEDINSLILFLSQFLNSDEVYCSRLVVPPGTYSFQAGLFLQGLLLNEYGRRELNSIELAANPYPVTAVDLSQGAVKQTPRYHLHLQAAHKHQSRYSEGGDSKLHESMLLPVRDMAHLASTLLRDMKHLPASQWSTLVKLFKKKLETMAYALLNLIYWFRKQDRKQSECQRHLSQALALEEADFLIVLAVAEKLQPGVYGYVMGHR